jgi:electron transfer flavoprotein beta subunit
MRKGLAMGADRGLLIHDHPDCAGSPAIVASALAAVLRNEVFDLILTGTQSDDHGYAQTGVLLAEFLDLPYATIVMQTEIDAERRRVRALREMESGWFQWVEMTLPALLTIQPGISAIRYPSLKGIMQAKRKEIQKISFSDLGLDLTAYPRLELSNLHPPQQHRGAEILEGDSISIVEQLLDRLKREAKVL